MAIFKKLTDKEIEERIFAAMNEANQQTALELLRANLNSGTMPEKQVENE